MKCKINMDTKAIKPYLLFISILLFYSTLSSCANKPDETIKMGIFSDAHFLSEQLMDGGPAIQEYDKMSGKTIIQAPAVLDQVISAYLNSDVKVILIPGDMTKDGEKQSHVDFVDKLKPLRDKGIRVFVVPGNHDINMPTSLGYRGDETYKVANITPSEFVEIYSDFGYSDAIKRDTNSLSYVAELNPSTWLLAIDSEKYEEYTSDWRTSSGRIKPETRQWITEVVNEAKKKNIQVVGMMHHNLLEHIPMEATFFKDYIVDDWEHLKDFFANLGIKVMFTGHFHINDIAEHIDDKGNKIHDVTTGSLVAYAYPYRFVDLNSKGMKITTQNIISTPDDPNLLENDKAIMQARIRDLALGIIEKRGMKMDDKTKDMLVDVVSKVFIKRMAGDETMDDDLEGSIQNLSKELGIPVGLYTTMQEDDKHSDNNDTEIKF